MGHGGGDRRREETVLQVNLGRSIVINGAFATRSSQISLRTCYCMVDFSMSPEIGELPPRALATLTPVVPNVRTEF